MILRNLLQLASPPGSSNENNNYREVENKLTISISSFRSFHTVRCNRYTGSTILMQFYCSVSVQSFISPILVEPLTTLEPSGCLSNLSLLIIMFMLQFNYRSCSIRIWLALLLCYSSDYLYAWLILMPEPRKNNIRGPCKSCKQTKP
jgi:hypothetical protein